MEEQQTITLKQALEIIEEPKKYIKYFEHAKDFCFNIKLHQALKVLGDYAKDAASIGEENRRGTIFYGDKGPCYDEYSTENKMIITEHGNPEKVLLVADKEFYQRNLEGEE